MTTSRRLLRALGAAGVCFAFGTTDGRPLACPGYCDEHDGRRRRLAFYDQTLTDIRALTTMTRQQLAWRLVAAEFVGVAVVFWSTSFVFGLLIAAVVFAVLAVLGR